MSKIANSRVIRFEPNNYLVLLGHDVSTDNLTGLLKLLIPALDKAPKQGSTFIDFGTLVSVGDAEQLIAIASLKLQYELPVIKIRIEYRQPITSEIMKIDTDQFSGDAQAWSDAIEDFVTALQPTIDGYRQVVTYGC